MTQPAKDARYYSYSWTGASPTDALQEQLFEKQLLVSKDEAAKPTMLAHVRQNVAVLFDLKCMLWRFTPLTGPGQLGRPIKVFTCETDGTRVVPGRPKVEGARPNPNMLSVGEQIEVLWGLREKTGRPDEGWPGWVHLTRPFIEKVTVTMGFAGDVDARLVTHAPQTDQQRGSVSSSVSYSFNFGLFGSAATGGISADYSHSSSMELTDYLIRSDSGVRNTQHSVRLAMLDGGQRYDSWETAPAGAVLPARATSDMALAMQGIWELADLSDELEFKINVAVEIGMLTSKGFAPYMNQVFRLTQPAVRVMMPPDIFGPNTPMNHADGTPAYRYEPFKPEDKLHASTTFNWERTVKVPLAMADKPIPTDD